MLSPEHVVKMSRTKNTVSSVTGQTIHLTLETQQIFKAGNSIIMKYDFRSKLKQLKSYIVQTGDHNILKFTNIITILEGFHDYDK
jgi:hypothetical protein